MEIDKLIVEDSKSGYQFYEKSLKNIKVISSEGKSKIFSITKDIDYFLLMADGAAFGPEINSVDSVIKYKINSIDYFPESFEFLILKSFFSEDREIRQILESPYNFIDSNKFKSWEQFFHKLLVEHTEGLEEYKRYSKSEITEWYVENSDKVYNLIEKEVNLKIKENEGVVLNWL